MVQNPFDVGIQSTHIWHNHMKYGLCISWYKHIYPFFFWYKIALLLVQPCNIWFNISHWYTFSFWYLIQHNLYLWYKTFMLWHKTISPLMQNRFTSLVQLLFLLSTQSFHFWYKTTILGYNYLLPDVNVFTLYFNIITSLLIQNHLSRSNT